MQMPRTGRYVIHPRAITVKDQLMAKTAFNDAVPMIISSRTIGIQSTEMKKIVLKLNYKAHFNDGTEFS